MRIIIIYNSDVPGGGAGAGLRCRQLSMRPITAYEHYRGWPSSVVATDRTVAIHSSLCVQALSGCYIGYGEWLADSALAGFGELPQLPRAN